MKISKLKGKTYVTREDGVTLAIYDKSGWCEYYLNVLPKKVEKILCGHLDTCSGDWCAREAEPCICPPDRWFDMGWEHSLDD